MRTFTSVTERLIRQTAPWRVTAVLYHNAGAYFADIISVKAPLDMSSNLGV